MVSLQKLKGKIGLKLFETGNPEVFPIVFRLFYNLYEDYPNEEEIIEEINTIQGQKLHPDLEKMIDELNPGIQNASSLITSAFSAYPGKIAKKFRRQLGL